MRIAAAVALLSLLVACSGETSPGGDAPPADAGDQLFPDVVTAAATQSADGTWRFDVTLSSPYDTTERYADAWRILAPDGSEVGVRELLHDHQNEQPFTRSLHGVHIPADVTTVVVEGRDQVNGWGGGTVELALVG
ncbi:MAG: hypothetical protein AAF081_18130 [Actinomycetota bacterium]